MASINQLQTQLHGSSMNTPPAPSRGMLTALFDKSKVGVFCPAENGWTIYGDSNGQTLRFDPLNLVPRVVADSSVPEEAKKALESASQTAAASKHILKSWHSETSRGVEGNPRTWVYTVHSDAESEASYKGAEALRSGLAIEARNAGINSDHIGGGPGLKSCRYFGESAGIGKGRIDLTTRGWTFTSPRMLRGQRGNVFVGPGHSRSSFLPSTDGDGSGAGE